MPGHTPGESRHEGRRRAPSSPVERGEPSDVAAIVRLQATAGNKAVTAALGVQRQGAPAAALPTVATPGTTRGSIDAAAETIYSALHVGGLSGDEIESILRLMLENRDRAAELRQAYQNAYHLELESDLRAMGAANALKAHDYLTQGRLQAVSKIAIALHGAGTDTTTLWRVLKEAHDEGDPGTKWDALRDTPGLELMERFSGESLEAALDADLDGYELTKGKAILAEGNLRPVDKVFIAMEQAGTDEPLLFEGLAGANADTIENEYRTYSHASSGGGGFDLLADLDSELSGEDYDRALALINRERAGSSWFGTTPTRRIAPGQRLVAFVRAAVSGLGTNTQLIWDQIARATPEEKNELAALVQRGDDPLGLRGFWGDLNDADLAHLHALLGIREQAGASGGLTDAQAADPTVRELRAAGGVDHDTVFDTIKLSSGSRLRAYKEGWEGASAFHDYVWNNVLAAEAAHLSTIFDPDLRRRLDWCIGAFTDDEDYLFHLLGVVATDTDRRRLSADRGFVDMLRANLSSSEFDRALTLLRPADQTEQERAQWLNDAVGRERSGFFDFFTSTGEAVQDENRELQAGIVTSGLDAALTPAERAVLDRQAGRTQQALDDYVGARDEFANTSSMVVNLAVGVVAAILTGGGSIPMTAAAMARAAAAMAFTRVMSEKVIRGDRFDIIGADGAAAFASGAVDGVMNVVDGVAARGLVTSIFGGIEQTATGVARSSFQRVALAGLTRVTEGGISGGASGLVDSASRDETWRQGFVTGLERSIRAAGTGAGQGAAIAGAVFVAGQAWARWRGAEPGAGGTEHLGADHPVIAAVRSGEPGAAQALVDAMGAWETGIRHLQAGTGFATGLAADVRADIVAKLQAHRQSVVDHLGRQFEARPAQGASTEPVSDVDLSVAGDRAGANLLAAEAYLDSAFPGWRTKYRMALMVDATRVGTYAEVLDSLSPEARQVIQARVTRETEALTFARRLRNVDAAQRAALLQDPPPGLDVRRAQQLADLGDDARQALRDQALLAGDQKLARLREATDPGERARLAEEVTYHQMLADAMGDDAYISPGGVRRFVQNQPLRNVHERYQAVLDQIETMDHAVHAAGGVLEATRSYELFKYIKRLCQVLSDAGVQDAELPFFLHWSELVYRVDRAATGAAARSGGIDPASLATSAPRAGVRYTDLGQPAGVPSDEFLLDNYRRFQAFADRHAADLRQQALGTPGTGGAGGSPESTAAGRPPVRTPDPTPADGATRSGGQGYRERVPPPIPLGPGVNQVLGNALSDEATARSTLRRLANGDASAMQAIGVTPPAGYTPSGREWGLGQRNGQYVIVQGETGGVNWEDLMRQGVTPLAHTHPTWASRALSRAVIPITDLTGGGFSLDAMYVLPSVSDFGFCARNGLRSHHVETPYSHKGGIAVGNPGEGPPVTFQIVNATTPGYIRGVGMVHTARLEMIVQGRPVWSGDVWAWESGVPVVQAHPPAERIIPFSPGTPGRTP